MTAISIEAVYGCYQYRGCLWQCYEIQVENKTSTAIKV